jgi:hypothetical protein
MSACVFRAEQERVADKESLDDTSESSQVYDLPCYTATASAEETVMPAKEQDVEPVSDDQPEADVTAEQEGNRSQVPTSTSQAL